MHLPAQKHDLMALKFLTQHPKTQNIVMKVNGK